jgi:hypothetical protein
MSADSTRDASMPLSRAARDRRRDRMRDQQRLEAERLGRVIAEERRLAAEKDKADAVIARARDAVARRQALLDAAIAALVDTSGAGRAAILLDRAETELARLHRTHRHPRGGPQHPSPTENGHRSP